MDDKFGLKAAAERGIKLREIGDRILLENDFVRVWEVKLEPGETLGIHIHYHPYLVLSLSGGANEIETISGRKIATDGTAGCFYCNPKGNEHGPAIAREETVVVEIYDGPHYPHKPDWYTDERDAH